MAKVVINLTQLQTVSRLLESLSMDCIALRDQIFSVKTKLETGGYNSKAMKAGAGGRAIDLLTHIREQTSRLKINADKCLGSNDSTVENTHTYVDKIATSVSETDDKITVLLRPLFGMSDDTIPSVFGAQYQMAKDNFDATLKPYDDRIAELEKQLAALQPTLNYCHDEQILWETGVEAGVIKSKIAAEKEAREKARIEAQKVFDESNVATLRGLCDPNNDYLIPDEMLAKYMAATGLSKEEMIPLLEKLSMDVVATTSGYCGYTSYGVPKSEAELGEMIDNALLHDYASEESKKAQTAIYEERAKQTEWAEIKAKSVASRMFSEDDQSKYRQLTPELQKDVQNGGMSTAAAYEIMQKQNDARSAAFNSLDGDLKEAVKHGAMSVESATEINDKRVRPENTKLGEVVPDNKNAMPKNTSTPVTDTHAQEVSTPKQEAPKVQQEAPKVQQEAPKVQQEAPKVQQEAPKVQEASISEPDVSAGSDSPKSQLHAGSDTEYNPRASATTSHADSIKSFNSDYSVNTDEITLTEAEMLAPDDVDMVQEQFVQDNTPEWSDFPTDNAPQWSDFPSDNTPQRVDFQQATVQENNVFGALEHQGSQLGGGMGYDENLMEYAEFTGRTPEEVIASGEQILAEGMAHQQAPSAEQIAHTQEVLANVAATGALQEAVNSGVIDMNTAQMLSQDMNNGNISPQDVQQFIQTMQGNSTQQMTSSVTPLDVRGGMPNGETQQVFSFPNEGNGYFESQAQSQSTGDPNLDAYLKATGQTYEQLMEADARRREEYVRNGGKL